MNPRIKRFLSILVPLTLAVTVPAGMAFAKGSEWTIAPVVVLSLVVIGLGFFLLDENSLRAGPVLGVVALMGLFTLAVAVAFFFSCAANLNLHVPR